MEAIRGTITKFIYKHPTSGWKIAKFSPFGGGSDFSVKGDMAQSNLDCDVTIKGNWVENGSYGREFQVNNVIRSAPNTVESVRDWLIEEAPGIGPGKAQKLADLYGSDLKRIIEFEPLKLTAVKGISKASALSASMIFIKDANLREVQLFLFQTNTSDKLARKVINLYGDKSVQMIQDNPYRLTAVPGIGFKTADKMALGLGWSVQRPERLDAALTYLLQEAYTQGHAFLYRGELLEKVCRLAELEVAGKTELLPEVDAIQALDRTVRLEEIKAESIKINNIDQTLYYLPKVYKLEKKVAQRIAELQSTPHVAPQNIDKVLARVEKDLQMKLSDEQKKGIISVIANNLSIITGLPGTGKTSAVRALVALARALGLAVELAAPTGRAAKRLSEVTNLQAMTIHWPQGWSQARPGLHSIHQERDRTAAGRDGTRRRSRAGSVVRRKVRVTVVSRLKNEIGNTYGTLTVVRRSKKKSFAAYWTCICTCGVSKDFSGAHLRNRVIIYCGIPAKHPERIIIHRGRAVIDEVGHVYQDLTVVSRDYSFPKRPGAYWLCHCVCGGKRIMQGANLRSGRAGRCASDPAHNPATIAAEEKKAVFTNMVKAVAVEMSVPGYFHNKQRRHDREATLGQARGEVVRRLSMDPHLKVELGKTYGHLTIVSRDLTRISKVAYWNCVCVCGNRRSYSGTYLRLGYVSSCGCQPRSDLQKLLDAKRLLDHRTPYVGTVKATPIPLVGVWKNIVSRGAAGVRRFLSL